jgi:hypothetical protein
LGRRGKAVGLIVTRGFAVRNTGSFAMLIASAAPSLRGNAMRLAARKKRQGQNRLPGLIRYEHHQGQVVVAHLFLQLSDCGLGIRKCRRNIWQISTIRIVLDPIPSVYREEILRHRTPPSGQLSRALQQFR